jgi:retron-type reverse transcriptase
MSNKGTGGVDGIEIEGFKSHLQNVWPTVKIALQENNYEPSAVRRVEIPKSGGGTRILGIPTLLDRMIQQAIAQQLMIIYDDNLAKVAMDLDLDVMLTKLCCKHNVTSMRDIVM